MRTENPFGLAEIGEHGLRRNHVQRRTALGDEFSQAAGSKEINRCPASTQRLVTKPEPLK
ncbi:hypothetical protein NB063_07205 [Rhodopirellula sp. ICT_H3.1]|uniref:Uncharacterized protein n=1 Tax=Aporhodopirellula aestuarii TaxID=2950107 RepID=A0ABT0U0N7_9BACT|nr:hypothetical protein [Aporhodopirellula aestuarii]